MLIPLAQGGNRYFLAPTVDQSIKNAETDNTSKGRSLHTPFAAPEALQFAAPERQTPDGTPAPWSILSVRASAYQVNGGYYYITAITDDGYPFSYDKKSYITSYYDANTAKASLGVNSDGPASAGTVYLADRGTAWESGYAISGSRSEYLTFSMG